MVKINTTPLYFILLFLLISCGDEAKESADFTGPFVQCPPAPTQGFSDPICCVGNLIDAGVGFALKLPIPIPIGQMIQSKIPGIEQKCGQSPIQDIVRGNERINDAIERAQEGSYNASRLLCETNGTCDSSSGLDPKKQTKIPDILGKGITQAEDDLAKNSGTSDSFQGGVNPFGNSGGTSDKSGAGNPGGGGGFGFFGTKPTSPSAENKDNGQKQEAYLAELDQTGGKHTSGGAKNKGAKGAGKNESDTSIKSLLGKEGEGEEERGLASLQFGAQNTEAAGLSALGSPDPTDYFSRIDIYSSLFKIVEKKYRQKQMSWKIQDSESSE